MVERLTEIFKTADGKFFSSQKEALGHETRQAIKTAIYQAVELSLYDEFGKVFSTPVRYQSTYNHEGIYASERWVDSFATELLNQGFRYEGKK